MYLPPVVYHLNPVVEVLPGSLWTAHCSLSNTLENVSERVNVLVYAMHSFNSFPARSNRGGGFKSRFNEALQGAQDKAKPGRMNFSSVA